jgi:hypothetical protein
MTQIYSEKCVVKQLCHCVNIRVYLHNLKWLRHHYIHNLRRTSTESQQKFNVMYGEPSADQNAVMQGITVFIILETDFHQHKP